MLMALQVSEQQKTQDVLVNEANAHTVYTTVCLSCLAWMCWTNSLSAFTTSNSFISPSILLPGILTSLCKYHPLSSSSLGICVCRSQPWTHVLCRILQTLCCWTQTSSGLNPEAKSADICFHPELLGMECRQGITDHV